MLFRSIRKGLERGQKVVVSGQFLIDSEASLRGSAMRMSEPASGAAAASTHKGKGLVERVDKGEITLSHDPIPSLQWGAMTMGFKVPADMNPGVGTGDRVEFEFRQGKDGTFEITRIAKAGK